MSWLIAVVALVSASVPPAQAATASGFEHLREQDLRVARVAYRLSISGKALCRQLQLGFVLRSAGQDDLVHHSTAPSEHLVSMNRIAPPRSDAATNQQARASLGGDPAGAATFRVARARVERDVRYAADLGCPMNVTLVPDRVVNAWADGERVMITTAIVDQCRSDDELALVIGHEMSHNILQHRRRLAAAGVEMGLLPASKTGSAAMRKTEEEADRLAVRMAGAAGYDLAQLVPFVRGLLATNGLSDHAAATHPASVRRLALLSAAVARASDGLNGR
jgi:predicted Zn-dependent protease